MSDFNQTSAILQNYLRARTPFVVLESIEPARVEALLSVLARKLSLRMELYSELKGFYTLDGKTACDAKKDPLVYLAETLPSRTMSVFVLYDLHYMNTETAYSRQLLNLVYLAKERGCSIVLVSADDVWSRLSQNGLHLKLDLPSMEERIEQVRDFNKGLRKAHNLNIEDLVCISTMMGGMSSQQIEMLLMSAAVTEEGLCVQSVSALAKSKDSIYGRIPSVSSVQVPKEVPVSGLEQLKSWLNEKRKVFFASDTALARRNLTPPRGILLCGVPGCGKSLSAKMIAREWRLPLYRFDIDNVLNKYVGESEKNMRLALEYIDHICPCVLWIDEIEKALNVSADGNETSKRILGQFLYWLQESKNRAFLVATANQIDLLPPELFRNGRVSEKFFLDLPTKRERRDAIRLYSEMCLLWQPSETQMQTLIDMTEGFSYADIEVAVKNMAEYMMIHEKEDVDFERLTAYFGAVVSTMESNAATVEKNRLWGKTGAINASKTE